MQILYVMVIWRKIHLRNMGVSSLSPMQAGDIGDCEVVKKLEVLRECGIKKRMTEESCGLALNYAQTHCEPKLCCGCQPSH